MQLFYRKQLIAIGALIKMDKLSINKNAYHAQLTILKQIALLYQLLMQGKPKTIKARAVIPIFYSSVTNTSKKIAYMLQDKLQSQNFIAVVTNIGNVSFEDFLQTTGPIVMIMSTYGNGGSPADGQDFVEWITHLDKKQYFKNLQPCIMGLGNRSFQHFCGNSKSIRQTLITQGSKQLLQLVTCNSASQNETAMDLFPQWSDNLIKILKQRYELKQISVQDLLTTYKAVKFHEPTDELDWEAKKQQWIPKLGKQFLSFYNSFQADVIEIKQMRKLNDGRSTLWIRMKIPQGLKLEPACNVSVYPENIRKQGQKHYEGNVRIETKKKNPKLPYPPMPLQRLWQISNLNQVCDVNTLKYAINIGKAPAQVKQSYQNLLKDVEHFENNPIRCHKVYEQLNPGIDFLVKLGINTVRPYTLSSWSPQKNQFQLLAAIQPLGLASRYFTSRPTQIRLNLTSSSFYVPEGRPVVMIGNGTGIAPFRSLTHYFLKNAKQLPQLYLYYGIQSKQVDYYFGQEWEALQKQGKIKLRIAQSRANSDKKVYVQDLVAEDKQFIAKHLFEDQGVIFICGGAGMAKGVDTALFESIKIKHTIPFKAFKVSKELENNKRIVKQIFE